MTVYVNTHPHYQCVTSHFSALRFLVLHVLSRNSQHILKPFSRYESAGMFVEPLHTWGLEHHHLSPHQLHFLLYWYLLTLWESWNSTHRPRSSAESWCISGIQRMTTFLGILQFGCFLQLLAYNSLYLGHFFKTLHTVSTSDMLYQCGLNCESHFIAFLKTTTKTPFYPC